MEKRKYIAEGDVIVITTISTYRVVSDNPNLSATGGDCDACAANSNGMQWMCQYFECLKRYRADGKDVHLELLGSEICVDKNLL